MRFLKVLACCTFFCGFSTVFAKNITEHLDAIKHDPNELYAFFKLMPKGGELHYHLDGGAYPETMLELAAKHSFCIESATFTIKPQNTHDCQGVLAQDLLNQQALYTKTIQAWSMSDFVASKESPHDHFHAVFSKINGFESHFRPELLAEVMARAANQNELYLEIYLSADNLHSMSFAPLIQHANTMAEKKQLLLQNTDFQKNIRSTVQESDRILKRAKQLLKCEHNSNQPVCNLTVKFQYFVLREHTPDEVFAQALNGFEAARQSKNIVGVNIVQVEDSVIALKNYRHHMRIFEFLNKTYPDVHIALHAGEINAQAVQPADLGFHIQDAIAIGHAQRIGHGVSIAYEDHVNSLLKKMQQTPIPVEVNLTSNRVALNVAGKDHPLRFYLNHHVPVVLSTDDEGILRTDLTRQYVEAVSTHNLNYPTIKHINRNVLTYAFLPGKSIWEPGEGDLAIHDCQVLDSQSCLAFIKNNPKGKLQWQLEHALNAFEKQYN